VSHHTPRFAGGENWPAFLARLRASGGNEHIEFMFLAEGRGE
jgi:hypothetical protein